MKEQEEQTMKKKNRSDSRRLLPMAAFIAVFISAFTLSGERYCSTAIEQEATSELTDSSKAECCVQVISREITKVKEVGTCKVTFYCQCQRCNGNNDKVAKDGSALEPFVTCAVDPSVIPLGSEVFVDFGDGNVWTLEARDTGSAIKGNVIDICVNTHEQALQLGVMKASVSFVI